CCAQQYNYTSRYNIYHSSSHISILISSFSIFFFFFFNDTATTEIYTLSLHDALPICQLNVRQAAAGQGGHPNYRASFPSTDGSRSEEHTSELQSLRHLVCRLLLEKKKKKKYISK